MTFGESFGLVAAEAQACGTPVVAAKVGGLVYVVDDGVTGILVEGWNPADYAEVLDRLLSDEGLCGSEALDDCYDAYKWLRLKGYEPDQIVLAGDPDSFDRAEEVAGEPLGLGHAVAAYDASGALVYTRGFWIRSDNAAARPPNTSKYTTGSRSPSKTRRTSSTTATGSSATSSMSTSFSAISASQSAGCDWMYSSVRAVQ